MAIKATSVIIEYAQLVANKNLQPLIEQAYGPQGKIFLIQVMEFFLSMVFQDTKNKGRKLCLYFINLLIFQKRLLKNMKDLKYFTLKDGHVELNSFKVSTTLLREVTMSTVRLIIPMKYQTMKSSTLQNKKKNCIVTTNGLTTFLKCNYSIK